MTFVKVEKLVQLIRQINENLKEEAMHNHDHDDEISKLIESSGHQMEEDCGPEGDGDEVDQVITQMIEEVSRFYEQESAMEAVYDALHSLIEESTLPDTPDVDATLEEKNNWIKLFSGNIKNKLIELGIDLTEG